MLSCISRNLLVIYEQEGLLGFVNSLFHSLKYMIYFISKLFGTTYINYKMINYINLDGNEVINKLECGFNSWVSSESALTIE